MLTNTRPDDLWRFSAKLFIDEARRQGGRALVHCNGKSSNVIFYYSYAWSVSVIIDIRRRYQSVTSLRRDVRYAGSWNFMGRRLVARSKPAILHFTERRFPHTTEGAYLTTFDGYRHLHSGWSHQILTIIQEYEAIYKAHNAVQSYPQQQRVMSRRKRDDDDDADALR